VWLDDTSGLGPHMVVEEPTIERRRLVDQAPSDNRSTPLRRNSSQRTPAVHPGLSWSVSVYTAATRVR